MFVFVYNKTVISDIHAAVLANEGIILLLYTSQINQSFQNNKSSYCTQLYIITTNIKYVPEYVFFSESKQKSVFMFCLTIFLLRYGYCFPQQIQI